MHISDVYNSLSQALSQEIIKNQLFGKNLRIRCKALSAREAIGLPEHDDYPIIKGKEVLVEAEFEGVKGQAFTDEFETANYQVQDLLELDLDTNRKRASFIAGLNAIYRYLGLCDKTIHCKDDEPIICADNLLKTIRFGKKILLVGFQPRFADILTKNYNVRIVDLDPDNIGKKVHNVVVESADKTDKAQKWCDSIFVTGSTVVNGTITDFLNQDKPAVFYGVTISAAARILNLDTFCFCGH